MAAPPLVNVNPATGRKALYIDPGTLIGIDGMPQDEADSLLDELLVHTVHMCVLCTTYHRRAATGLAVFCRKGNMLLGK